MRIARGTQRFGGRAAAIGASMVEQGGFTHLQGLMGGRLLWSHYGVGGERTDQINARLSVPLALSCLKLLIYDGGMNNIIQGWAAQAVKDDITAAAATCAAAGVWFVPCTMQPFKNYAGWTAGLEVIRQDVAGFVRTTWPTHVDYDLITGDGGNPPALQPSIDVGDGLHLTNGGDLVLSTGTFQRTFGGVPV